MKAILSADINNGIGINGGLIIRIPEDMKRFKKITSGHQIIMGRKTYESLPGKKPLPDRENIILSKTLEKADGFRIFRSTDELLEYIDYENAYVIGGGQIYELLLPYCTEVNLTRIEHELHADTFFPDLSKSPEWFLKGISQTFRYDLVKYHFEDYAKI